MMLDEVWNLHAFHMILFQECYNGVQATCRLLVGVALYPGVQRGGGGEAEEEETPW